MKHLQRLIALTLATLATSISCAAQGDGVARVTKTSMVDNFFKAQYEVLASDTSVRDGLYTLSYRESVIEKGEYRNGKRVGEWQFWNLMKQVELKYSYESHYPTYIMPHFGHKYDQQNYPCIFLGSPLVPFYFITNRVYYPKAEANNKKGGKVVVRLHINPKGRVKNIEIKQETSKAFGDVVTKAAAQIPRNQWRWIPALQNGKRVSGYYDITILFEN